MGKEYRLDPVRRVGGERLLITLDGSALTPFGIQDVDLQAEPLRHVDPQMAEHSEPGSQHLVTGRKGVGERGLPGTRPAGGKQEWLA
jgi:hypothetical protein